MSKINLDNFNWYGFDHEIVKKNFEGDLRYVGTFSIKGEPTPRAFYLNSSPNRKKNHKDYMTLQRWRGTTYVSGIDYEDLEPFRYQQGIQCSKCEDVIYSVTGHDCRSCCCGGCFIDGGRDTYYRVGGTDHKAVTIDLLAGEYKAATGE